MNSTGSGEGDVISELQHANRENVPGDLSDQSIIRYLPI